MRMQQIRRELARLELLLPKTEGNAPALAALTEMRLALGTNPPEERRKDPARSGKPRSWPRRPATG